MNCTKGAYRPPSRERHLDNIQKRILPAITVLPYDAATANIDRQIRARLEATGQMLADADLQIAATALYHGLELATGHLRHFGRIDGLRKQHSLPSLPITIKTLLNESVDIAPKRFSTTSSSLPRSSCNSGPTFSSKT